MLTIIKKKSVFWDLIGSILLGLFIIGIISYFTTGTVLAWLDSNYAYRQSITITNATGGSSQTNYQVQVAVDTATLITAGKMQNTCFDVRFGNSSDTNLTFWRESACSTTAGKNTLFWVTIPSISAGPSTATIYMYYGYASATDASSYSSYPTGISVGTGVDGTCSVSSTITLDGASANTCVSRAQADGVSFASTANNTAGQNQVTTSTTHTGLSVDDEILIINLMGTAGDNSNVGKYETARITTIATNTLTLNHNLVNGYNGTSATQKIVIQRIPQYTNVTVNSGGTITASAFDGTKGGIIAFRSNGTLTVSSGGTIEASSLGFRSQTGGAGGIWGGAAAGSGAQETYTGTVSTTNAGSPGNNSSGSGAGGGGGGSGGGGAGGGYSGTGSTSTGGTAGGRGACGANDGYGGCASAGGNGGGGGSASTGNAAYGAAALATIFLGSSGFSGGGGGAGGENLGGNGGNGGASGIGGGIIIIGANTVTVAGTIKANGGNGSAGSIGSNGACNGSICFGGGGGGGGGGGSGSGGSILINSAATTFGSSLITSTTGTAGAGGQGGDGVNAGTGAGGGGGGGNPGGARGPRYICCYYADAGVSGNNAGGVGTTGRIAANYSTTSGSSDPAASNTVVPIASAPNGDEAGVGDATPTPTLTPTATPSPTSNPGNAIDIRVKSNIRVKSDVRLGH